MGKSPPPIEINFALREDDTWKHTLAVPVDSENPAIVKKTDEDYMIQGISAFSPELMMMTPIHIAMQS